MRPTVALLALVPLFAAGPGPASAQQPQVVVSHGLAMHGDMKYKEDFRHFDYADPAAARGGEVKQYGLGTFDSFNPFVIRGNASGAVLSTFDTLMVGSDDEPFTEYCLLCETVEVPADRSWVAFTLRPQARFHDGSPVTADDVIWSFETLRAKGRPFYRAYYANVEKVEKQGERKVRFSFAPGENRELPLIIGQLYVMSKAWWSGRDFERSSLDIPLGSGPYRIKTFEAGRFVTLERVPDYWGADLPVRVGHNNFGTVRIDYYRDQTVALEAFKGGEYDIRLENSALLWATAYESPAFQQKLFVKEEIPERRVSGMQGFVMNQRRAIFKDPRVRQALAHAFDFEWSNRNLFHGAYTRTRSYFDNSEMAASGLPGPAELAILEPLRGQVPDEVFTKEYNPPKTDGSGDWREGRREATRLLREAGWRIDNQRLVGADGKQMEFEILLSSAQFERIALPYTENLKLLGIAARVRTVDIPQYQRRMEDFDYDMTVEVFGQSESPGNEQRNYWSSAKADETGGGNSAGLKSAAVDQLVELLIAAPDRASLVTRVRALDRVLQWSHLVVPHWHVRADRVAYWDKFARPKLLGRSGFNSSVWWVDPRKESALAERRGRAPR